MSRARRVSDERTLRPRHPWWVAAVVLGVGLVASGLLTGHDLGGRLPGCGPRSGCDVLAASSWARVPVLDWPVAFVATSYFAAMLVAWCAARGRLPPALAWISRVAAATSVAYLGAMLALGHACAYCLLVHASSLSFAALVPRPLRGSAPARPRRIAGAFAVTLVAVLIPLARTHGRALASRRAEAGRERARVVDVVTREAAASPAPSARADDRWGASGFTGRYRLGPQLARVRIVAFTDYQCPDCERIEAEIERLLAAHPDVSLSLKHFPLNADCNPHLQSSLHDNACWAARAAEAAGMLGGDAAFWAMHRWLFSVRGNFRSEAELRAGAAAAGIELDALVPAMEGPETLARVKTDIEDGVALGIWFTPMVFVNGVEVKWSLAPEDTVTKTVDELLVRDLPPRSAEADRPPLAAEKFLADWRMQPEKAVAPPAHAWPLGQAAGTPRAEVIVFGDYLTASSRDVDRALRAALTTRSGVRYTFRHYPLEAACNAFLPERVAASALRAGDCEAARAAVAAGLLGGATAFRAVHEHLMTEGTAPDGAALAELARRGGLDARKLAETMAAPEVSAALAEDAHAAKDLGLSSLPLVLVNGRLVPRPLRDGDDVLGRILDEAMRRQEGE